MKEPKAIGNRIVVKPISDENKTASGIIVPNLNKDQPRKGEVLSVGKGTKETPMQISKGEVVLYGNYGGTKVELEGVEYVIIDQNDIYGIIE